MRPARPSRPGGPALLPRLLALVLAALVVLAPAPAVAAPDTGGGTAVAISPVDLDGPVIADVTVTVENGGDRRMRDLAVSFEGPVGWAVQPETRTVKGSLRTGQEAEVTFQLQVPERRPGLVVRHFTATATYRGGDGAGSATATRAERSGTPLAHVSQAYDTVGITDEAATGAGNFDGEGNSFSAQRLAAVGLTPGARVEALGAELTWPDVPAGTADNVASAGQAIALPGEGSKVVLLGSGVGRQATGSLTVHYTDGSTSSGSFGFPNWSFQDTGAHGATLVAATDGRNRPDGYGNAGIDYNVFAHAVPLDAGKTVEFVVLPANAAVHVFDLALAP
ncbi:MULTISPECIES: NEW3 domain-containing protein [Streptomyces]|uniref:NEW3 domain-containing protein n=1 Tax=Streptomyces TaxID=1883 RepID=UPI002B05C038|nr:NEW3 domain-containing protein [Streptomyces sp. JHD 1]